VEIGWCGIAPESCYGSGVQRDWQDLPGGELVREGLEDLGAGRETAAALLVAIGAPRLRNLGLDVPAVATPERRLYDLLANEEPDSAHSRYNALIRRLVSFERALECESERAASE
jgi:hypothetical protein